MIRPRLSLAALLIACSAASATRPTSAALRKAFEANQATVVQVIGPKRTGTGVMVGAQGHVVTSVDYSGLDSAKVKVEGVELPASVLFADGVLGVVVLRIEGQGEFRAAAVRLDARFQKGDWLVGLRRDGAGVLAPVAGQVYSGPTGRSAFFETDLPLPNGSPLFDPQGRLVAVTVKKRGKYSSRALPLWAIKAGLMGGGLDGGAR